MKKLIFCLTLFVFTLSGFSQPLTPYAPNVVVQDINGVTHDLYNYLDQNRKVVLEFYNSTHTASINSRPGVEDLYTNFGLGGDLSHAILSIDLDSNTNTESAFQAAYGISSAITDSIQKFMAYNPDVNKPMFIIICPDRLWQVRYGSIFDDESYITSMSSNCASLSSHTLDGKIFEYFGNPQYCDGANEASFYLQNYSYENPLTSAKIVAKEGGIERGSVIWNGSLDPYEIDTVTIELNDISGVDIITFELEEINSLTDGQIGNNSFSQMFQEGNIIQSELTFKFTTDFNPDQFEWYIVQEITGDTIWNSFDYTYQPNTAYQYDFDFHMFSDGCYEFFIEDSFGDGLINGVTPEGTALGSLMLLSDINDEILINEIAYEHGTSRKFSINKSLGSIELESTQIKLDENPFNNKMTISGLKGQGAIVNIISTDGKYIGSFSAENESMTIDTHDWKKGIYIIEVKEGEGTTVVKAIK